MGQLEPTKPDVPASHMALAKALRTLFDALGVSMTRYAARCNCDKAAVSRYLSGARVPPWPFVRDLIAHVTEDRGHPVNAETVATVRELYVRAAGAGKGRRRSQDLQHLLEEADQQAREAASLEKLLRNALHESQQQVAHLNVEINSIRAARASDRQAISSEIEKFSSEADDLKSEREALKQEVEILKRQLKEAVTARLLAEGKCDQLERQIEDAESREMAEAKARGEEERLAAERQEDEAKRKIEALQREIDTLRGAAAPKSKEPLPDYLLDHHRNDGNTPAATYGYTPGETLRRVDAARKREPKDIAKILVRAIELQSDSEVIVTRAMLRGMPEWVPGLFENLLVQKNKESGGSFGLSRAHDNTETVHVSKARESAEGEEIGR
ncbi:helix-turn-helix domain-containing protein [Streptomyces bacillaris]